MLAHVNNENVFKKRWYLVILSSLIVQGSEFACYFWTSILCISLLSKGHWRREPSISVLSCFSDRQILKKIGSNFFKLVLHLSLGQNLGTWISQTNTTKRRCLVHTAIGLRQVKICIKLMSKSDRQIWTLERSTTTGWLNSFSSRRLFHYLHERA